MEEADTILMTTAGVSGGLTTTLVLGLEEVSEFIKLFRIHLTPNFDLSGTFRILSNGRDAELSCEFPRGSHLISNVVWDRVDRGRSSYYYNDYRRYVL